MNVRTIVYLSTPVSVCPVIENLDCTVHTHTYKTESTPAKDRVRETNILLDLYNEIHSENAISY